MLKKSHAGSEIYAADKANSRVANEPARVVFRSVFGPLVHRELAPGLPFGVTEIACEAKCAIGAATLRGILFPTILIACEVKIDDLAPLIWILFRRLPIRR